MYKKPKIWMFSKSLLYEICTDHKMIQLCRYLRWGNNLVFYHAYSIWFRPQNLAGSDDVQNLAGMNLFVSKKLKQKENCKKIVWWKCSFLRGFGKVFTLYTPISPDFETSVPPESHYLHCPKPGHKLRLCYFFSLLPGFPIVAKPFANITLGH